MTASETKLLPCPFCGEKRISLNMPTKDYRYGSINCPACLAVMPGEVRDQNELICCWNARALTAALSNQVVVPKEPTQEMLDNAFVNGPLPMSGLDGSEQSKRERATVAEVYRAMIAAAPPPSSTADA